MLNAGEFVVVDFSARFSKPAAGWLRWNSFCCCPAGLVTFLARLHRLVGHQGRVVEQSKPHKIGRSQEDSAMKKYRVPPPAEERQSLQSLICAGKAAALRLARARILLKADAAPGAPAWPDERIAEAVE